MIKHIVDEIKKLNCLETNELGFARNERALRTDLEEDEQVKFYVEQVNNCLEELDYLVESWLDLVQNFAKYLNKKPSHLRKKYSNKPRETKL